MPHHPHSVHHRGSPGGHRHHPHAHRGTGSPGPEREHRREQRTEPGAEAGRIQPYADASPARESASYIPAPALSDCPKRGGSGPCDHNCHECLSPARSPR